MSDLEQDNHEFEVAKLVRDPVGPLSQAAVVAFTGELFTARWARVCRKALDASDDLPADLVRFELLDLFRRRVLDSEAISFHFASSTSRSPPRPVRVRWHVLEGLEILGVVGEGRTHSFIHHLGHRAVARSSLELQRTVNVLLQVDGHATSITHEAECSARTL